MHFIVAYLMFLTTHVTVFLCHAELKGYLLTYLLTYIFNSEYNRTAKIQISLILPPQIFTRATTP